MADNKKVIRRFIDEVLNERRFEQMDELVGEGFGEFDHYLRLRQDLSREVYIGRRSSSFNT